MKKEFKKGELVLVKDIDDKKWVERIFISKYKDKYFAQDCLDEELAYAWSEIKKIEPVYRLLNKDEITKEGDQIMMTHDIWAMAKEGVKVGYSTIRRKIKTYEE